MQPARQIARAQPDGDDVRRRILDAAEEVFAGRGYAAATTREIAERAGIGKRMVFYYFPNKDAVYRAVLERVLVGLVAIHQHIRENPGQVAGLPAAAEQLTRFAATNVCAVKVWLREIIDGGPHLAGLTNEYLKPLFTQVAGEVERNMQRGIFRPGDPMQVLMNVGGLTLFYFLMQPLLEIVWERDPLAPETVDARAAAVRDFLLHGLAGAAAREGASS